MVMKSQPSPRRALEKLQEKRKKALQWKLKLQEKKNRAIQQTTKKSIVFEDTQAEECSESKENEEDEVDLGDSEEAPIDTTSSRKQPDNNVSNNDEDVDKVQILLSTPPKTRTSAATKSQPVP